jgi:hypothetical protein
MGSLFSISFGVFWAAAICVACNSDGASTSGLGVAGMMPGAGGFAGTIAGAGTGGMAGGNGMAQAGMGSAGSSGAGGPGAIGGMGGGGAGGAISGSGGSGGSSPATCSSSPPEAACFADANGVFAVKTVIDVWWQDDAVPPLVDPGRDRITVYSMNEISGVCAEDMAGRRRSEAAVPCFHRSRATPTATCS